MTYFITLVKITICMVLLAGVRSTAKKGLFSRKHGRVVLSPSELANLVWEEQLMTKKSPPQEHIQKMIEDSYQDENASKDDERLKSRKIWSRWSKWSKCSATCGGGMLTRRRMCMVGRCAPGEREEQHRACALAPCADAADAAAATAAPTAVDEIHDDAE